MRFSVIVEKPLKVKYILCHSNPAVRTLIVNYGQFSLFPGEAISSLRFNPLGVQMASKETENILLQNFGVANKEHYGYVMAFSVVVNSRYCGK